MANLGDDLWCPEEHPVDGDLQAEGAGRALTQVQVRLIDSQLTAIRTL